MYLSLSQHYDDIEEDQMEFHQYCMRKSALRTYVNTLKWEDSVRDHKFYAAAMQGAARV